MIISEKSIETLREKITAINERLLTSKQYPLNFDWQQNGKKFLNSLLIQELTRKSNSLTINSHLKKLACALDNHRHESHQMLMANVFLNISGIIQTRPVHLPPDIGIFDVYFMFTTDQTEQKCKIILGESELIENEHDDIIKVLDKHSLFLQLKMWEQLEILKINSYMLDTLPGIRQLHPAKLVERWRK